MSSNLFNVQLSPKLSTYLIHSSDYEKVRKLGKGSYGHVDLVKNITTNDKYAMKIIFFNYDFSDDDVQSFYREVEIMAEVNHPSVLKLNGFSLPTKKRQYATILTPYMPNGSLESLLSKTNNSSNDNAQKIDLKNNEFEFNFARKLIIIFGVAAGMQYLHHMNIIHRDLKPGNILLNDRYEPFIGDFGFSKFTETKDSIKQSMTGGTPLYMAPELYDNYTYGFKVDVYAFAMLMYEVLSGMEPFEEIKNPNSIPLKVCNGARPNIPSFIPLPFKNLIKECWEANPAERPTFDEIVEKLLKIDIVECIRNDHGIGNDNTSNRHRKKDNKSTPISKKKRNNDNKRKNKSKGRNQSDNDDYDDKSNSNEDPENSESNFYDDEEEASIEKEYLLVKRYIERVLSQPYIFSTINKLSEETKNLTEKVKSLESTVKNLSSENATMHKLISKIFKAIKLNGISNNNNDEDEDDNDNDNDDNSGDVMETPNSKQKKNVKMGDISDIKSDGFLFESNNPLYLLNKDRGTKSDKPNSTDFQKIVGFNGFGNYITTVLNADSHNNGVMTPKRNISHDNKLNIFDYNTANDFLRKDLVVKFDSRHGIIETLKNRQRTPFDKIVIESQSSGDIYQIINSSSADRYTSSSEGHSWIQFRFPEPLQLTGIRLTSSRNHFIRSWRFIALVEVNKSKNKNKNKKKHINKNKKKDDSEDDEYSPSGDEYEYEYEYDIIKDHSDGDFEEEEEDDDDDEYENSDDDDFRRRKNKNKRNKNRRNRNNKRRNKRRNLKYKKIVVYENNNERQLSKPLAECEIKFEDEITASIYRIEQAGPAWDDKEAISLKNVEFLMKKELLNQNQKTDSNGDDDENSDVSNKNSIIDLFSTYLKGVNGEPHRVKVIITSNDFDFESYQYVNTDTCLQTYSKPVPSWFQIEFSHGKLQTTGYRIKRNKQMMLKSWSLIASNDKSQKLEKWEVIHTVNESKEGDLGAISTFKCKNKLFFKYFRLVQKQPCWDGSNVLVLYHFDLFGHYKEEI